MPEPVSSPTGWTVRPALLSDAPGVAALLTELGSPGVDEAEARRRLARGREQVFVAERADDPGAELGGLVAATVEHYFGHELPLVQVTALVTSPAARRSGAARQLMGAAMAHAEAHRCAGVELTCGLAREDAHRFYRSIGYEVTSSRFWQPVGVMTVHAWAELTREELSAVLPDALVVLPIGATEQHGPHLPTGTDALVVDAVVRAAAAAASTPRDLVLCPTLPFGASDHHFPFGGTLSLRVETMTEVLVDLARSVAVAGARRLLVVNGHGGNRGPSASAAQRAALDHELRIAHADYWELLLADAPADRDGPPVPGHAGAFESSLVAHLRPALVRELPERPSARPAPATGVTVQEQASWARIDGYTDSPAAAGADAGQRWFDACVAALAGRIETLAAA